MQSYFRQLVITDMAIESVQVHLSSGQLEHPVVAPAQASSSGQLGHQVVVPAHEAGTSSDLAQSVAYMAYAASGASTSNLAWRVVGADK